MTEQQLAVRSRLIFAILFTVFATALALSLADHDCVLAALGNL